MLILYKLYIYIYILCMRTKFWLTSIWVYLRTRRLFTILSTGSHHHPSLEAVTGNWGGSQLQTWDAPKLQTWNIMEPLSDLCNCYICFIPSIFLGTSKSDLGMLKTRNGHEFNQILRIGGFLPGLTFQASISLYSYNYSYDYEYKYEKYTNQWSLKLSI